MKELLKTMRPELKSGAYVFCTVNDDYVFDNKIVRCFFKEDEGITLVLRKQDADHLNLKYTYVAAWITLKVHSSLAAIGFTAAFSSALSNNGISCNVIAAYYHDHIFVPHEDAEKALNILQNLSLL